jgi:hypothetical protein
MDNLPAEQTDSGRANKWAAAAYLAKAYLYQEKWQEAANLFDNVIQNGTNPNGTPYELTSSYQDMFDSSTENNSGTVFDVQQKGPEGSLWGGGAFKSRFGDVLNYPHSPSPWNCCGFYQPTLWLVNSYRVDETNGLPKSLDPAEGPNVKNDQGVGESEKFSLGDQSVDPRLDMGDLFSLESRGPERRVRSNVVRRLSLGDQTPRQSTREPDPRSDMIAALADATPGPSTMARPCHLRLEAGEPPAI